MSHAPIGTTPGTPHVLIRHTLSAVLFVVAALLLIGCAAQRPAASGAEPSPNPKPDTTTLGDSAADRAPKTLTHNGLRVMTYNIRWPNPDDGPDRWDVRRPRVVQTIRRLRPDLLGVQECYRFQADFLLAGLPGYTLVGAGRDDGAQQGEMTAILFRDDRLERVDHGHLWLSDTPDVPGSVGWDADLTRMATWAVLRDRRAGDTWLAVNTHFDHAGSNARTESAKLLGRFILDKRAELGPNTPVVLMGDFNAGVYSAPYLELCGAIGGPRLVDTYRAARYRARRDGPEGTFNRFRNHHDGARIDWVLTSRNVITLEAGIDRTRLDGRNPSDHDPVWAVLRRVR
jgi:endonuclease/exonuclease/phosphatase family metal-dependent hydrolase